MRKNNLLILTMVMFLFYFAFSKEFKQKSNQEILVPIEKKFNEKEFSKTCIKNKKQKKEIKVEVK